QRAADWLAHYERLATKPATFRDYYSGNLSLPKATFEAVGGFAADVPVEKDTEFALRLQAAGLGFAYVPDAVAVEDNREGWQEICRETEHRGELTVELYRRHPALLSESELGGRESLGRSWLALRRLLLALRVPPLPLALVGRALPDGAARPWF